MYLPRISHTASGLTFVLLVLFWINISAASEPPTVRITSPKDGAVVHSGTTFSVTAEATAGAFRGVILNDDGNLGGWFGLLDQTVEHPPYVFSVSVPADASAGVYKIWAAGARGKDISDWVQSPEISIDIERPDEPKTLSADQDYYLLGPVDRKTTIRVLGIFADGSTVNLTRSTRTTYTAEPPGIISVEHGGMVEVRRPGQVKVVIRNGRATCVVRIAVQR